MALQHARSGQVVRIPPMSDPSSDGRTTAMIKADQLEVVRIVLPAGKVFPEHRVQGEITVFCLEGQILFRTPPRAERSGRRLAQDHQGDAAQNPHRRQHQSGGDRLTQKKRATHGGDHRNAELDCCGRGGAQAANGQVPNGVADARGQCSGGHRVGKAWHIPGRAVQAGNGDTEHDSRNRRAREVAGCHLGRVAGALAAQLVNAPGHARDQHQQCAMQRRR